MKTNYKRFTKRALLFILISNFSMLSFAKTYYVSNSGNDSNNGITAATAWQSLAIVNATTFNAGDQILLKKDDVFYGSLIIKNSGASGNPITLGTYGTGANPTITGFTTVSAWTNLGSNIWESTSAVSALSTCKIVSVNGVNTPMGHYPNSSVNNGWLTIESHSGNTSITCSALTGTPNWTGAEIVVRDGSYIMDVRTITSQSGGTLNFSALNYEPYNTLGFFVQNDVRTLDQPDEWYYNPSTKKIRIYSTSQPTNVKVASIDNLLTINGSYVTIDGINFSGANTNAVYTSLTNLTNTTIQNCTISFSGETGIKFRSSTLTILNNTINESNNRAVDVMMSSNVTISHNSTMNSGMLAGMAVKDGTEGIWASLYLGGINGLLCEYNSIINSGYNGILFGGGSSNNATIQYNFIDNFCSVLDDGGGIYGGKNATIDHNIIINGIGAWKGTSATSGGIAVGIYLDDDSQNNIVTNNSVANCAAHGIYLHNASNNSVTGNTVYNSTFNQLYVQDDGNTGDITNNVITDNVLVSKSAEQFVAQYRFPATYYSIGTLDRNVYAKPINNALPIWATVGSAVANYSLANWKTYSGKDANSKISTQTISSESDLQFEYNATTTPKMVTISRPMMDVKGNKYSTTTTLQPFTSVVLMKDLTPSVVPDAPTTIVATAGNASASITFAAPASGGGSTITGYTVTSIPAGGIDSNAGSTSLTHNITGLTNGTAYTFAVKATNSAGTSVASVASNSVIPKAPVATSFLFSGPSSGSVNSASANFTVTPNNLYTGTITITPSGVGSSGLSAKVLTFSNSANAQTFTITPTVAGSITLTATNNGTLANPTNLVFTSNAILPDAPTLVVATSGDAIATVSFVAPINTGGAAITGYTVTSISGGGTDINAGSTSLTHMITGLSNGTYIFTVKATNSVGSSVASVASNPIENIITKQGEIIPSHFTTVWQGLNGLNHMNINVVSAALEDIPLSADDEIAVFSGSACVGTSKLIKSINPSDNTTFLTILASQNDGTVNGFVDNDTIVFKIWNNKTQKELQVNSVVYRNDITSWKTNGRYSPGATAVAEIASYQVFTQSIELLKGYNMISTYVSPQNPNVSAVTKTLMDQGNLIKMQDETGNSFENWDTFGGWINKLGSLEETEGYKIQVANNCTLQVTGRPIAMPFDISLKTGWNIISFPRTDFVNAINVVQSLIDQNKLVKVQDEAGNSIENWGLFGGWKNGIGNFIPGKAYKVKMSADAILTFQESYPKSALVVAKAEPTEYYHTSVEGNGTDHMNINITGLNSVGISEGDELAAFDGAICVASIKITKANLLSGTASLASSFSTNDQIPNGFKSGDLIQISAWSKVSGNESKVVAEVIAGQMKYEKNASVLVKLKSASTATAITDLNDPVKIDVFPNPCQGRVTVRFSEIPEANSRIEISDLSGRKLVSRLITGTSEEFNLDSFTSGLYLVRSILGSSEFVQKLIVNK